MTFLIWLQYLAAISILISTPGTAVALVATHSKLPLKFPMWIIAGGNAASLLLLVAAVAGLGQLTAYVGSDTVRTIGGCYLLYAAASQYFSHQKEENKSGMAEGKILPYFAKAFFAGISNPKDILFFASFLSYFLSEPAGQSEVQGAVLLATWCAADWLIMMVYLYLFRKQGLVSQKKMNMLGSVCIAVVGILLIWK